MGLREAVAPSRSGSARILSFSGYLSRQAPQAKGDYDFYNFR